MKEEKGLTVKTPVPDMLATLEERIKGIKTITDTPYKTTGNLESFGDIKKETKVENLIRAFSSVMGRERAYGEAAKELGKTTFPQFEISGGDSEAWKHDIKLRISIIEQDETLKKLTTFKDKMTSFLSEEEQKGMLLKEMESYLMKG